MDVTIPFLIAVVGAALGVLALWQLVRGRSVFPDHRGSKLNPVRVRQVGQAVAAGLIVLVVTRWPTAGAAAGVLVALWPRVFGGAAAGRRELEKIEAIASWTEALRDTASAAAGLEQAIPATVESAPELLRWPLRDMSARLAGRVPLPEALTHFADDVADPAADMVVAALSLNARQRAGGLERILSALAVSARSELEMRRKIEVERRGLRRQAQRIAGSVVGFVVLQALFARGWVAPYSTPAGQLVLALLIGVFMAAFVRMRSLAVSRPATRFLTSPDAVTEIASYKPHSSLAGRHS